MRRLLLVLLLVLAPLATLAQDTAQPDGTIAAETSSEQDLAIAERLRGILAQLDGYEDVRVGVTNGIVTFRGTALGADEITRLDTIAARLDGVVAIENRVTESTDVTRRLDPVVERMEDRLHSFLAFLPLIGVAFVTGLLVFLLGLWVARRDYPYSRIAPNVFIAGIYRMLTRLIFAVLGLVVALDILDLTGLLGTIMGAAGIVGLAVGFAVRDTVENFIASIMLSMRQPFRPNDLVEIEGNLGHVIRLTSRATILLSLDGNHIRLPNATVFKSKIVNFSRHPDRRFDFAVGIEPGADIERALGIMETALRDLPFTLDDPAPAVWVDRMGPSTIDFTATAWIRQHETSFAMAKGEAIRLVKARLEEAGIALPEPTYRLITTTGETSAARPVAEATAAKAAEAVPPTEQQALERIVEADREKADDQGRDLLNRRGPEE